MSDHEDWQISIEFLEFLESLWGPYTIDRFASVMNNKTTISIFLTHFSGYLRHFDHIFLIKN